jgi:hypothetical protein
VIAKSTLRCFPGFLPPKLGDVVSLGLPKSHIVDVIHAASFRSPTLSMLYTLLPFEVPRCRCYTRCFFSKSHVVGVIHAASFRSPTLSMLYTLLHFEVPRCRCYTHCVLSKSHVVDFILAASFRSPTFAVTFAATDPPSLSLFSHQTATRST